MRGLKGFHPLFLFPIVMTAVAFVCSCTDKQQECMECDKQADVQMAFEGRRNRCPAVDGWTSSEGMPRPGSGSPATLVPMVCHLSSPPHEPLPERIAKRGGSAPFPDRRTDRQHNTKRTHAPPPAEPRRQNHRHHRRRHRYRRRQERHPPTKFRQTEHPAYLRTATPPQGHGGAFLDLL